MASILAVTQGSMKKKKKKKKVGFIPKWCGNEEKMVTVGPLTRNEAVDCFTIAQSNTSHITQPKLLRIPTQKLFSYLSTSAALFTHKPKGKNVSKDYCSKADSPLVFSITLAPHFRASLRARGIIQQPKLLCTVQL